MAMHVTTRLLSEGDWVPIKEMILNYQGQLLNSGVNPAAIEELLDECTVWLRENARAIAPDLNGKRFDEFFGHLSVGFLIKLSRRERNVKSQNKAVWNIIKDDESYTTQEVANLLKVSRPHVNKLVDRGEIPGHLVGKHRRILGKDLVEYRKAAFARSRAAASRLGKMAAQERKSQNFRSF